MTTVWAILATSAVSAIAISLLPFAYAQDSYALLPVGQTVYRAVWEASPDKQAVEAAAITEVVSGGIEIACLVILTVNIMTNWESLGWFLQIKAFQCACVAWFANAARFTDWFSIAGRQLSPLVMSLAGSCLVSPPATFFHAAALYGTAIYTSYVFPAASSDAAFRTRPAAAALIVWFGVLLAIFPAIAPLIQPLGIGPWGFSISASCGIAAVGALILRKLWRMACAPPKAAAGQNPSLVESLAEVLQGVILPVVLMTEIIYVLAQSSPEGCPPWARGGNPIGSPPAGATFPQGFNTTTAAQRDRLVATVAIPTSFSLSSAAAFVIVFATLLVEIQGRLSYLRARDIVKGERVLREAVGSVSHAARGPLNAAALCLALLQQKNQDGATDDWEERPGAGGAIGRDKLVQELRAAIQRSQRHLDGLLTWEKTSQSSAQKLMDAVQGKWESLGETLRMKLRRAYMAEAKTSGVDFRLEATKVLDRDADGPLAADASHVEVFSDHDRLLALIMNMLSHAFASVATTFEHDAPTVVLTPSVRPLTAVEAAGASLTPAFDPRSHQATTSAGAASGGGAGEARHEDDDSEEKDEDEDEDRCQLRMLQLTVRYTRGPNAPSVRDVQSGAVWKLFGAAQRAQPSRMHSTHSSTLSRASRGFKGDQRAASGETLPSGDATIVPVPLTAKAGDGAKPGSSRARWLWPRHRGSSDVVPAPQPADASGANTSLPARFDSPRADEWSEDRHQPNTSHDSSHQHQAQAQVNLSLPIVRAIAVGALNGRVEFRHRVTPTRATAAAAAAAAASAAGSSNPASGSGVELEVEAVIPVMCRVGREQEAAGAASAGAGTPPGEAAGSQAVLKGAEVAVCDDDNTSRWLLEKYLKRIGAKCGRGFSDGADVLAAVNRAIFGDPDDAACLADAADAVVWEIPDVLLLDSHMCRLGGMETLKALAKLKASGRPPGHSEEAWSRLQDMVVVIVTGEELGRIRAGFLAAGAFAVLGKPVDTVEVRDVLLKALQGRPRGQHA